MNNHFISTQLVLLKLSRCFLLCMLLLSSACHSYKTISMLPAQLQESSGMLYDPAKKEIWLHNDSGDKPKLYALSLQGELLRTIFIQQAEHIDWEDMTKDAKGNIYLGDIGNNLNRRKNLTIYKLAPLTAWNSDSLVAEAIHFKYSDQESFPPARKYQNFDAEALVAWKDSLYIFTKNRTKPMNRWVKCYRLPNIPGNYTAELVDSVRIGQISFVQSITAAAISPDGNTLALLAAAKLRLWSGFSNGQFFQGSKLQKKSIPFSQKEALDFVDNHSILISNEHYRFWKAKLVLLKLK